MKDSHKLLAALSRQGIDRKNAKAALDELARVDLNHEDFVDPARRKLLRTGLQLASFLTLEVKLGLLTYIGAVERAQAQVPFGFIKKLRPDLAHVLCNGTNEKLTRTPGGAGNRQRWTVSLWFKRTANGAAWETLFSADSAGAGTLIQISNTDTLVFWWDSAAPNNIMGTTATITDTTTFHHFVLAVDSTLSSPNNFKMYLDGALVSAFATDNRANAAFASASFHVNNTVIQQVASAYSNEYFNGRLSDFYLIDGLQLTMDSFGQSYAGSWHPRAYTGTYGTNGVHLFGEAMTSAAIGNDSSGSGLNYALTNMDGTNYGAGGPT